MFIKNTYGNWSLTVTYILEKYIKNRFFFYYLFLCIIFIKMLEIALVILLIIYSNKNRSLCVCVCLYAVFWRDLLHVKLQDLARMYFYVCSYVPRSECLDIFIRFLWFNFYTIFSVVFKFHSDFSTFVKGIGFQT